MAVMILGIIEILICIASLFFKKQEHYIISLTAYNTLLLTQYFLQGFILDGGLVIIDLIKSIVFFFYAKKHLKPNLFVIISITAISVAVSIFLWQNWFSIFLLLSSILITFATWQRNMLVMRICVVISSVFLMINYFFTGLYTTIIAEAITFVAGIFSIFIFHIIPHIKKQKNN